MPKKQPTAAKRARTAQQADPDTPYTALLRAAETAPDAPRRAQAVGPDDAAQAEPAPADGWPYRLVDSRWQGWLHTGGGQYRADMGFGRGLDTLPYGRIVAERGPVRPVGAIPNRDATLLPAIWRRCGRKALATTLVALTRLAVRLPYEWDGPHPLTAGREGSWESARLLEVAFTIGHTLDARPARYDEQAAEEIATILQSWISHPDVYQEVAANLASDFGRFTDDAGGWTKVADQWFQPGARAGHDHDTVFAVGSWLLNGSSDHLQTFLHA